MKKEKAISKIQKLLGLAGNNPNEHERLRAMEAAYEMLAKHNLEMADVTGVDANLGPDARVINQSIRELWARDIWQDIGRLSFCRVLWGGGGVKPWVPVIIGTFENSKATVEISNWLVKTIKSEARRVYKDDAARQRSFCTGASCAVAYKVEGILEAERRKAEQERIFRVITGKVEPGTSIVKVRHDLQAENLAVQKRLSEKMPVEDNAKRAKVAPVDQQAVLAGMHYGKTLEVNRQTPESRRIKG